MQIYKMDGRVLADVNVEDASTLVRGIMQIDTLTLIFKIDKALDLEARDYVIHEGQRYYLYRSPEVRKIATSWLEYTATFHSLAMSLDDILIKDDSKPARTKFTFTGKPADFVRLIVRNMGDGWSVGEVIDKEDKTIAFSAQSCYNALGVIAQTYETEWEIEGRRIHLRKIEHNKSTPLPLSYGKGNGFVSGVSRIGSSDKQIGRLYVDGGERNIDPAKYKARALMLPKSARLEYQGHIYHTDADGTYVYRQYNTLLTQSAVSLTHIYPKRVGTLTGVTVVDETKHFYDVIDSSIPADLDYSKYRIPGQKAVIKFESGILAGREFEIKQTDKALTGYHHDTRRFEIVPQEIDGIVMPGGVFVPRVGDKYAIFNIDLPESYTRAASDEMFREAVKYLADKTDPMFEFGGKLDAVWSTRRWLEIGGKIKPGGHVLFSDPEFHPDGTVIRIVSVTQHLNNPTAPEMTLSNTRVSGSFGSTLAKLEAQEVLIDKGLKDAYKYSERQWQHIKATRDALEGMTDLLGYDKSITPIAAQMMQLIVGDERLQFRFVRSRSDLTPVVHEITHKVEGAQLIAPAGTIQHMTLGINAISSAHTEYKVWDVARYESPALERKKTYYLYIKAPITGTSATYRLVTSPIAMDADAGYYNLLVGLSVDGLEGRSFARVHGFTEILPGRITTPRLVSPDGRDYVDFEGKRYHFGWQGGYLDINSMGDGKTRLKGALINVGEGDTTIEDYLERNKGVTYFAIVRPQGTWHNDEMQDLQFYVSLSGLDGTPITTGYATEWRHMMVKDNGSGDWTSWVASSGRVYRIGTHTRKEARIDVECKVTYKGKTVIVTASVINKRDGKDGNPYTSILSVEGSWRNNLVRGVVAKARVVDTTGYEWFGAETYWRYRYRSGSNAPEFGAWASGRSTLTISDTTNTSDYLDIECKQIYNGYTCFSSYSLANVKDGDPGSPGNPGTDGKGVVSIVKEWAKTTDPDNPPSQGSSLWSSIPPQPEAGKYIWERTTTTYTEGAPTRTTPIRVELTGVSKALAEAFETSTEITGGLVATTMLLVRNALGKIRAYFSGAGTADDDVVFGAGVDNFGLPGETQRTAIYHDGSAKFGQLRIRKGGEMRVSDHKGDPVIKFGGELPSSAFFSLNRQPDGLFSRTFEMQGERWCSRGTEVHIGKVIDIILDEPTPVEMWANREVVGETKGYVYYYKVRYPDGQVVKCPDISVTTLRPEGWDEPVMLLQAGLLPGKYRVDLYIRSGSSQTVKYNMLSWLATTEKTVRAQYSEKGYAVSFGAKNFVHLSESGMRVGEETSMPGVLCAGVVKRNGAVIKSWGAKKNQRNNDKPYVENIGTGRYKIHHRIGHSQYVPMLTPYQVRSMAMDVQEISDYYFIVRCWDTSGKEPWDDGFTYACFGAG